MVSAAFRVFRGEVPKLPAYELPEGGAQLASNVDLQHAEIRGLRGNAQFAQTTLAAALRAVYTDDGTHFFGWPYEVYPVRSMIAGGDIYYRVYYTAMQADGPIIKVARTRRADGTTNPPYVAGTAIVGGNFQPPENSNPVAQGGNGQGPDSWLLGVPAPAVQGGPTTDGLAVKLVDKAQWPNAPNLQLKVTYFLENQTGDIVFQQDITNLDTVASAPAVWGPFPTYTNVFASNPPNRGNKVQDMLFFFGNQQKPYKYYFYLPPSTAGVALSRTVVVNVPGAPNTASTTIPWTGPPPVPGFAPPLAVPPGSSYTVLSATSVSYAGNVFTGVGTITNFDGTTTTCAAIIQNAGGQNYSLSELKPGVLVQAIDPDQNGLTWFTVYSSGSQQTAKNVSTVVPGGVWIDTFDFTGDATNNVVLTMWKKYFDTLGVDYRTQYSPAWLGFKINYGVSEGRAYTLTYQNDFNEESIPCPAATIGATIMHDVQATGVFVAPAPVGNALYVPIRQFNLYRAVTTTDGNFVYERVPVNPVGVKFGLNNPPQIIDPLTGQLAIFPHSVYLAYPGDYVDAFGWQITDNVLSQNLGIALPSTDWDAPPLRTLKGLTAWRNGMMAAYVDNLLYICEPYRPFTFPGKYVKVLPWNFVGLRVDENALIAVTDGEPYIFTGSHPSNVVYEKLQGVQAGVKPTPVNGFVNPTRALTRTPRGVIYASKEGPIVVQGGRASFIWRDLFTREEWMKRYGALLTSMRLAYFDGRVIGYFDSSLAPGFIINIEGAEPQMTEFVPASPITSEFLLQGNDSLHVVTYANPVSTLSRFADETISRVPCTYWCADQVVKDPANMAVLQLVGNGSVTATVYVEGTPIGNPATYVLASRLNVLGQEGEQTQRVPSGIKARRWSVLLQLAQDAWVSEALLAESVAELKRT